MRRRLRCGLGLQGKVVHKMFFEKFEVRILSHDWVGVGWQYGLLCFQRNGTTPVPGCSGNGATSKDYCYIPPSGTLVVAGNDWQPPSAFPLGRCQGDCDWDGDCEVRQTS